MAMPRLPLLLMVFVMLVLSGCSEAPEPLYDRPNGTWNSSARFPEPGPCGALRIKQPFFNVTFVLPADSGIAGGWLHILPNETIEAAKYAIHTCAAIGWVNLSHGPNASLELPVGDYVLAYGGWADAKLGLLRSSHAQPLPGANNGSGQWVAFRVQR